MGTSMSPPRLAGDLRAGLAATSPAPALLTGEPCAPNAWAATNVANAPVSATRRVRNRIAIPRSITACNTAATSAAFNRTLPFDRRRESMTHLDQTGSIRTQLLPELAGGHPLGLPLRIPC